MDENELLRKEYDKVRDELIQNKKTKIRRLSWSLRILTLLILILGIRNVYLVVLYMLVLIIKTRGIDR